MEGGGSGSGGGISGAYVSIIVNGGDSGSLQAVAAALRPAHVCVARVYMYIAPRRAGAPHFRLGEGRGRVSEIPHLARATRAS